MEIKSRESHSLLQIYSRGLTDLKAKLKIEINTREHFAFYGLQGYQLVLNSRWFSGSSDIISYRLDELIGTKSRAFYQRKKGRDLFDLWIASQQNDLNVLKTVQAFNYYMMQEGCTITRAMFEMNLKEGIEYLYTRYSTFISAKCCMEH